AVALQGEGVDAGARARALDAADAVQPAEHEVAVADRELVPVERPWSRPGGAVALRVELAAVTGAAEPAGGHGGDEPDLAGARPLQPVLLHEHRPVRLRRAAHVGAAAGHDREAGHAAGHTVRPYAG